MQALRSFAANLRFLVCGMLASLDCAVRPTDVYRSPRLKTALAPRDGPCGQICCGTFLLGNEWGMLWHICWTLDWCFFSIYALRRPTPQRGHMCRDENSTAVGNWRTSLSSFANCQALVCEQLSTRCPEHPPRQNIRRGNVVGHGILRG